MAANLKSVKNRMKSVENTMQITRAMELVASSRLKKARERAAATEPAFQVLSAALREMAEGNRELSSPYLKPGKGTKCLYVVIAGDRGLAGGYNANLFRAFGTDTAGEDVSVLPLGKKAVEYFRYRGIPILSEEWAVVQDISVADCFGIARRLCDAWNTGEYQRIGLYYTHFLNVLSQVPSPSALLPLSDFAPEQGHAAEARNLILYEPDCETVFNAVVPEYLTGLIFCGVCDSVASELAARRTAMENATDNGEKMLETLQLSYNRARQAGITSEISEIVAGAGETGGT